MPSAKHKLNERIGRIIGSPVTANIVATFAIVIACGSAVVAYRSDGYIRGLALAERRVEFVNMADKQVSLLDRVLSELDNELTRSKENMERDDLIALSTLRQQLVGIRRDLETYSSILENEWSKSDPDSIGRMKINLSKRSRSLEELGRKFAELKQRTNDKTGALVPPQ